MNEETSHKVVEVRGAPTLEVLVFELAGQQYALDAMGVQEVTRAVAVIKLPEAPPIVEGIVDVRGTLVPVLDVRTRFGLPQRAPHHGDHLILARAGDRLVALRSDRAVALVRLDPREVEDVRGAVPGSGHVTGVARLPSGLVLIHDLRTFLSLEEEGTLDGALAARGGEA